MNLSRILMPTLKDPPGDAEIAGHQLLVRSGMLMQAASGLHRWLPLGQMVIDRLTRLISDAFEKAGALAVSLPVIKLPEHSPEESTPADEWDGFFSVADQKGRSYLLRSPSMEEIGEMAGKLIDSAKQLPVSLYCISEGFRDEQKPKGGPLKAREFLTASVFSFHGDEKSLKCFNDCVEASFEDIFNKCRVNAVKIADGHWGSIRFVTRWNGGGREVLSCSCGFKCDSEDAPLKERPVGSIEPQNSASAEPEKIHTPAMGTIEGLCGFLKTGPDSIIKAMVFMADGEPLMALVRGDGSLDPLLLQKAAGAESLRMATPDEIFSFTGGPVGFSGPVGIDSRRILADTEISHMKTAVTGANAHDYHLKGVVPGVHFRPGVYANLRKARKGDPCPRCYEPLDKWDAISLGRISNFGNAPFGKTGFYAGSCVIGISRLIAMTAQLNNDKDGLIWPSGIGPFDVVVIPVNQDDKWQMDKALEIYRELNSAAIRTAFEDRDRRPGFKFKDAELAGYPVRVVIGGKSRLENSAEIKPRTGGSAEMVPLEDAVSRVTEILSQQNKLSSINQECPC